MGRGKKRSNVPKVKPKEAPSDQSTSEMAEPDSYMRVLIEFKHEYKVITCHRSEKCSALVAITNLVSMLPAMKLRPDFVEAAQADPSVIVADREQLRNDVMLGLDDVLEDLLAPKNGSLEDVIEEVVAPKGGSLEDAIEEVLAPNDQSLEYVITDKQLIPSDILKLVDGKVEVLRRIASSLGSAITLDPVNNSCNTFKQCDVLALFAILEIPLLHGWVLDTEDNDLSSVKGVSHSSIAQKIAEAEQTYGKDHPLIERLKDFGNKSITLQGMACLNSKLADGDFAILYADNGFNVLYKHSEYLFTLEASEDTVAKVPKSVWKKLSIDKETSFHVTSNFSPTEGQHKHKKRLARKWFLEKLGAEFDEKPVSKRNLKNELQNERDHSTSTDVSTSNEPPPTTTDNVSTSTEPPPPEDVAGLDSTSTDVSTSIEHPPPTMDNDSTSSDSPPATTADKFLQFLLNFQDGFSRNNAPHFGGIAIGMANTNSFKIYVPFEFIQKHDGGLAIDIQDESPGILMELERSAQTYLNKYGVMDVKLEIMNLPEPKSNQKFEQFVKDNVIVATYEMYGGLQDHTPTIVGVEMGDRFLNHIFDRFEQGKGWSNNWLPKEMEVRNKAKDFIITKEPDADLTPELGIKNLLHYAKTIFPHFKVGDKLPAYFATFEEDVMSFPDPNDDPVAWRRFVKYMRSAFLMRAPLVRSSLICEVHRVIALQLEINRYTLALLTRRFLSHKSKDNDWREHAKHSKPFSQVYRFRNKVSQDYSRDKWENSHWHVIKYSRNFIEHALQYLKTMFRLHDISRGTNGVKETCKVYCSRHKDYCPQIWC